MPLFKYLKRRHADGLLIMGTIRIGTLNDFRRTEHARGVADPAGGKKLIFHDIDYQHFANPEDAAAFNEFSPIKVKAPNVTFVNLTLQNERMSPDCFVLCFSSECSEAVRSEFDGLDACIRIYDQVGFFEELTATLNAVCRVKFQGVHECRYRKRREAWNGRDLGEHPAIIKEPQFRKQKEVRALWFPVEPRPIQPMVIGCAQLMKFCQDVSKEIFASILVGDAVLPI